jgi:hypothetical protein
MAKLPFPNNVIEDFRYLADNSFTAPEHLSAVGSVDMKFMLDFFMTEPSVFKLIYEGVAESTAFDFSNVNLSAADIQTNFEFAVRLLKEDLFALPFDDTLFVMSNSEAVLLSRERRGKGLIITPCVYCPVVKGAEQRLLLPLASFADMEGLWHYIETKKVPEKGDNLGVKMAQFLTPNGIELAFQGKRDFYDFITMELTKLGLACNQLLMSPHVKTEYHPAPVKLNKARAAKGKPAIGDRYKITLRGFSTARDPSKSMAGGTHASPTPHWRRGHIRHLDGGRVVPVMPTLVGAQGVQSDIGKKMYEYARRKE